MLVGGGRMGTALLEGILASGAVDAAAVLVVEPDPERRALLKQHPEVVSWAEFFAAQRKHRSAV